MRVSLSAPALAVAALLPLAATVGAADAPKVNVDPAVYNDLVYYANYVRASSTVPCAKPPHAAAVQGYVNVNLSDTQATVYRDDARAQFVVAIPGTASLQDVLTDLTFAPLPYMPVSGDHCTGCAVHAGFNAAWTSAAHDTAAVLDAGLKDHPTYAVVVAGHSLGGAIASLAFASFASAGKYRVTSAFTYGEPRVGNPAFADYIDRLAGAAETAPGIYHRVTHADDGVPQLPPEILGFRHSRTEYWETNVQSTGTPDAGSTFRCFGQEAADCNDGQHGVGTGTNDAHGTYAGFAGVDCKA